MAFTGSNVEKSEAFQICQDFLDGPWRDIKLSEFQFSPVSGGLSNFIFRCSLPENVAMKDPNVPKDVLLRIYGLVQDETNVIVTETTTFMLLAERKLGPKLHGIFPRGRLEGFIPSRSLKKSDYRSYYKYIAREFAKIHVLDVPIRKVPDFLPFHFNKWIKAIEDVTKKYNKSFDLKDMFIEEMNFLMGEIKKTNSKVVFCHNDLQGGNILLRQDSKPESEPEIVLIDFEFGAYNYRSFDLANQFCEWCFDYNTGEFPFFTWDPEKFPTKEEQTSYIRAYLEQVVLEGALSPSKVEEEIQIILGEITLFAMAAHLLWSLWSVKMSLTDCPDFSHFVSAHREHGKVRRKCYWMFKEQLLNTTLSNGVPK